MSTKWQKCELEYTRNTGIANKCNAYVVMLAARLEVWEKRCSKKGNNIEYVHVSREWFHCTRKPYSC